MKLSPFILSLIALILITGCDEPIELDTQQLPPLLVVEGLLTDRPEKNYVKLTTTVAFYDTIKPPAVNNATVKISGSDGTTVNLLNYSGANTDSTAFYLPETPFSALPFVNYTLEITHDGKTYTAEDMMRPTMDLDSLTSEVDEWYKSWEPEDDRFYRLTLFADEPDETVDYYMFRFYRNHAIERRFETDIYIVEDFALTDMANGVPLPIYYALDDTAVVELYNISRQAHVYYTDLQFVLGNDGGMFSPPPANPKTNISNDALGYFMVASLQSDTLIIQ